MYDIYGPVHSVSQDEFCIFESCLHTSTIIVRYLHFVIVTFSLIYLDRERKQKSLLRNECLKVTQQK
jgi:hypothetical protein